MPIEQIDTDEGMLLVGSNRRLPLPVPPNATLSSPAPGAAPSPGAPAPVPAPIAPGAAPIAPAPNIQQILAQEPNETVARDPGNGMSPLGQANMSAKLAERLTDMNRVAAAPNAPWQVKIGYLVQKYGLDATAGFVRGGGMASVSDFNTPEAQAAWSSQLAQWQDRASSQPGLFGMEELSLDPGVAQFLNVAGTVFGGATGGAGGAALGSGIAKVATGGSAEDAVKQAAAAFLASQIAGGVSNATGGGVPGSAAGGAAAGGTMAGISGGNVGQGMLTGAVSGGTSAAAGGGATGNALGNLVATAASGGNVGRALPNVALSALARLPSGAPTAPAPAARAPGMLSLDADEALRKRFAMGLRPDGGWQGLRASGEGPGISVPSDYPLGDPMSFINVGGSADYAPADFSLSGGSGDPGLRAPRVPGGPGLNVPTSAVFGDEASFVNAPEVRFGGPAGTITESGMLPLGTPPSLGDPASPINVGTAAQPGAEYRPGMLSAAAPQPVRATVIADREAGERPAAPAPAPRKFDDKKVERVVERLRSLGAIPSAGDAKAGESIKGLPVPPGAPKQSEGQSREQYVESLVRYVNTALGGDKQSGIDLSAERLADLGLTPGTPDYYEHVMSQLDDILARIFGDTDPDDAKFGEKIRSKTQTEMQDLYRVLYVRGVLGQLMGSGKYKDPFTDTEEDVIAPEGQRFNPALGAYQRGLARSFGGLKGLNPRDARSRLGGMLSRNPDLYGMQARMDARRIRDMLSEMGRGDAALGDEMRRKQRGMFGESAFFQSELDQLSAQDIRALLANTDDPEAALRALLSGQE